MGAKMSDAGQSQRKCDGLFANAIQRSQQNQLNLYFDKIIEVQSASFENAARSNNVNVTVIYAGSFLLIQATKDDIASGDWSIIVLSLFISLLLFALWSVSSSLRVSRLTIRSSKLLMNPHKSVSRKLAEFEVLERKNRQANLLYYATWGFAFFGAVSTGFFAALYLLLMYVLNLLGIDFSPYAQVINLLQWVQSE